MEGCVVSRIETEEWSLVLQFGTAKLVPLERV